MEASGSDGLGLSFSASPPVGEGVAAEVICLFQVPSHMDRVAEKNAWPPVCKAWVPGALCSPELGQWEAGGGA